MRKDLLSVLCGILLLAGCGAGGNSGAAVMVGDEPAGEVATLSSGISGKTNVFNPYMQKKLPNIRGLSSDGTKILGTMGGHAQSIEGEAAHRRHWREEIYPVVFGDPKSPHEVLVLLDFASPQSAAVWRAVMDAARMLPANQCKIAVFGNSRENYGTDLMGLAIWISYSRRGQAMPFLSYALERWNAVKAEQRSQGGAKIFRNEYDATAKPSDYPIHYAYLTRLQPPVPAGSELDVAKYCYDAGNVNMYQTMQISRYYGVGALPAVIVDGRPLQRISAQAIVNAMR